MSAIRFTLPLLTALACLPAQGLANQQFGPDLATFSAHGTATVIDVPARRAAAHVGRWSCTRATPLTRFDAILGVAVPDPKVAGGLVHTGTANAMSAGAQLSAAIGAIGAFGPGTGSRAQAHGQVTRAAGVRIAPAAAPRTNRSDVLAAHRDANANAAPEFQVHSTSTATPDSRGDTSDAADGGRVDRDAENATLDIEPSLLEHIRALTLVATNAGATDPCGRAPAGSGDRNDPFARCAGSGGGGEGLNGGIDFATWSDDTFALGAIDTRAGAPVLLQVVAVSEAATALLFGLGLAGLAGMRSLSGIA